MMCIFVVVLPKFQVLYVEIMYPNCWRGSPSKCFLHKVGLEISNLEEVNDTETFDLQALLKSCPSELYETTSFRLRMKE